MLSAEYKALSPEEKAQWQKLSAQDRARFNREMLSYVPPPPSPPTPSIRPAQVSGGNAATSASSSTTGDASDVSGGEDAEPVAVVVQAHTKAKKTKKKKGVCLYIGTYVWYVSCFIHLFETNHIVFLLLI